MNSTTIALTQFPPFDAFIVFASCTPGCDGNVVVGAHREGIQLRARGADEIGGPPDDGWSAPNSGAVTGLTPGEARELAAELLKAAAIVEGFIAAGCPG